MSTCPTESLATNADVAGDTVVSNTAGSDIEYSLPTVKWRHDKLPEDSFKYDSKQLTTCLEISRSDALSKLFKTYQSVAEQTGSKPVGLPELHYRADLMKPIYWLYGDDIMESFASNSLVDLFQRAREGQESRFGKTINNSQSHLCRMKLQGLHWDHVLQNVKETTSTSLYSSKGIARLCKAGGMRRARQEVDKSQMCGEVVGVYTRESIIVILTTYDLEDEQKNRRETVVKGYDDGSVVAQFTNEEEPYVYISPATVLGT